MSKPVVVAIPHELGRAEARRRIEQGIGQITGQIGAVGELQQAWEGDRLRFSLQAIGQAITGAIDVGEREVRLEVHLPGIFGMIAGKVKGRLQKEGQILLGPSRPR